jgi:hypothetical protein
MFASCQELAVKVACFPLSGHSSSAFVPQCGGERKREGLKEGRFLPVCIYSNLKIIVTRMWIVLRTRRFGGCDIWFVLVVLFERTVQGPLPR